jgi:hypothetical protein
VASVAEALATELEVSALAAPMPVPIGLRLECSVRRWAELVGSTIPHEYEGPTRPAVDLHVVSMIVAILLSLFAE